MKLLRSFRQALTVNFVLMACLPTLVFGVVIAYLWEEHLLSLARTTNSTLALELRSDAEFFLIEARRELTQIARVIDQPEIVARGELGAYLATAADNSFSFESLLLLDKKMSVVEVGLVEQRADHQRDFIGIDMSRHELLTPGPLKEPHWSSSFLSLISGRPTVTLAIPLRDGILLGNVSLTNLVELISRLVKTADNISLAIVDRDYSVIVSNHPDEVFEQVNFGFHPELATAETAVEKTSVDTHYGASYMESVIRLGETDWTIWVGQDTKMATASARDLRVSLLLFMLAVMLLAALAALRKSKLLMQPVGELLDSMLEIGNGSYQPDPAPLHYSELEVLHAGMQEMFVAVSEREKSLRDSEERFRLIFSLSPDATFLARFSDGYIVDVNEAFLHVSSHNRDEILGMAVQELALWSDARQWAGLREMLRMRRQIGNFEIRLQTQAGPKDVLTSATILDIAGEKFVLAMFRDVSAVRQAESRLQSSEMRYKTVLEAIEEGLTVFDESGALVTCNAAAEQLLGPRDELIGKSYRDIGGQTVREDGNAWKRQDIPVVRSLRRGEVVRNELMGLQREDGEMTWLEVNSSPLRGNLGQQINGAVVTFVNVTERRRRKELLDNIARGIASRTGTAFFSSLTRHLAKALSADVVMVSEIHPDRAGFFRTISISSPSGAIENLEYARQGTPCLEVIEDRICVYPANVQQLFPDDPLLVAMGVQAYVGRPLHNEQGEALGLIAVMFKRPASEVALTEQLLRIFAARAEAELVRSQSVEALETSEKQLRRLTGEFEALLEGIPDQILLVDENYRLIWANHGPESGAESYPERCHQIFHGRDIPCENCPVAKAFASGEVEESELTTPEGRHFMMRAVPIPDASGAVEKVIQMVQDVTDKVRLQQQQQHTGQLAALGELAAGVAHEINNPVNGIINYAQLIQNRFGDNESLRGLTERVINEGNRIATIVSELLYFAREGGDEVRLTSWQRIVEESLLLVGNQLRKDHIELDIAIEPDLPSIQSIATQLQQVLLNLISNARHALNEKYPEADDRKRLEITGYRDTQERVVLEITDFGAGIPTQELQKVLQPFYTTKPAGVGTGLGLSICHEIIKRHGGTIELESERGSFTRVTLVLPEATAAHAELLSGDGEAVAAIKEEVES